MPKDLSDVDPDEADLSPEQKRLMVWRDYFKLLRDGIVAQSKGGSKDEWTEKDVQTRLWLDVAITEIESDVMHLECGQEEYCRWGDAKALSELSGNIDVSQ